MASSADMAADTRSRATTCSWVAPRELLAGLVELALAVEELAVALLEHVRALVELLVALEEAALERWRARRAWRAPRPRPRAARRSFSSLASRISSFWRARASASMRRGLRPGGLHAPGMRDIACARGRRAAARRRRPRDATARTTVSPSVFLPSGRIVRPDASSHRDRHDRGSDGRVRRHRAEAVPRRGSSDRRSGPPRCGRDRAGSFGTPYRRRLERRGQA